MRLDYNHKTGAFLLRVSRAEANVHSLMEEHGFDLSVPESTKDLAVLFTHEPYAAAAFAPYATERAQEALLTITTEIDKSRASAGTGHYEVPAGKELWPFQVANLDYAMPRHNTLVADEPGLGKTEVAIVYANALQAKRVCVVVPANIRRQWVERIREWTTMRWPYTIHMIRSSRDGVSPVANWTVLSYELARSAPIWRALAKRQFDLVILDEGHYLKTIDAKRTRAVFGGGDHPIAEPLAERAEHIMALTGTPLPNRPREAYTLARGLCFDSIDWMSEESFRTRFNPSITIDFHDKRTGQVIGRRIDERTGRHAELQARLRTWFMTRHLKREVLPQLKLPIYDLIQIDDDGHAVKAALAAEKLLDIDPEALEGADAAILGQVATVRRMMGIAMAPLVADHIDMLIDGGEEKLVVFAWHTEVLDILEARLKQHGVVRFHAGQNLKNDRKKEAFITEPKCRIIMGNVLTLGTGTDGLQKVANHALIAEPDWVPGNNVQCFDRLDRGGQTRQVQGDIFVVVGSIAEKVLASALRKMQTTHKVLDGKPA